MLLENFSYFQIVNIDLSLIDLTGIELGPTKETVVIGFDIEELRFFKIKQS